MESRPFHVAVVGGGLVGSLAAIFLAKRGWQVEVFELRSGDAFLAFLVLIL